MSRHVTTTIEDGVAHLRLARPDSTDQDIVTACHFGNAMGAQRASATVLDAYLPFDETSAQIDLAYAESAEPAVEAPAAR